MASVTRTRPAIALLALAACGDIKNFSGDVPPLATIVVQVNGDVDAVRPAGQTGPLNLRVGLVWGEQWLPELLCAVPGAGSGSDPNIPFALAEGCRDPFGFVPQEVDANIAITPGVPATFELDTLPDASLLVGDITARIGYASLVVYDDRNGDGTLGLAHAHRLGNAGPGPMGSDDDGSDDGSAAFRLADTVYGASFVTMTAADQRIGYREGAFVPSAFYPRAGCGDPPPAFSVLAAGGFTPAAAVSAVLAGTLPPEDPATCSQVAPPEDETVEIAVSAPADVTEVACTETTDDSSVRYREPVDMSPDFTGRDAACVNVPTLGVGGGSGSGSGLGPGSGSTVELIVTGVVNGGSGSGSGSATDSCKGLTHYILKGCRESPDCAIPDWDHSAAPPSWWPC